ncbi:MAG: tetratricopeptide repeat protein [Pyrinomonadaceae bacterium]
MKSVRNEKYIRLFLIVIPALAMFLPILISAQTESWQRVSLTGTGLNVESPARLTLDQAKPHESERSFAALVRWSMNYRDVNATFNYEKQPNDKRTARERVEAIAMYFKNATTTASRVSDIKYLGGPAALLEEEFTDAKTNLKMRRNLIGFGSPGELTLINITFPREVPEAAAITDRLLKSVKISGPVAAESSLYPPVRWVRLNANGLSYETPTQELNPVCDSQFSRSLEYESTNYCVQWGKELTISIGTRRYTKGIPLDPRTFAESQVALMKTVDKELNISAKIEYSVSPFTIAGGDAVKLRHFESRGSLATVTETLYIRSGSFLWDARIYRSVEPKADEFAAQILKSFALAPDVVTKPPTTDASKEEPPSAVSQFLSNGKALASSGDHQGAIVQYAKGLELDPKHGALHFQRALSYEKLNRLNEAIQDYAAAISAGFSLRESHYNRGTVLYRKGSHPAAIAELGKAIEIDPKYVDAYYNRGLALFASKQLDPALADFAKLIEMDADNVNARIMRARVYCAAGLPTAAKMDQEAAIKLGGTVNIGCK